MATAGSGWLGGLQTVTGPLFGVRQFQPRAAKVCQVCLLPPSSLAAVVALDGLVADAVGADGAAPQPAARHATAVFSAISLHFWLNPHFVVPGMWPP
jgi:hypothetical protein